VVHLGELKEVFHASSRLDGGFVEANTFAPSMCDDIHVRDVAKNAGFGLRRLGIKPPATYERLAGKQNGPWIFHQA